MHPSLNVAFQDPSGPPWRKTISRESYASPMGGKTWLLRVTTKDNYEATESLYWAQFHLELEDQREMCRLKPLSGGQRHRLNHNPKTRTLTLDEHMASFGSSVPSCLAMQMTSDLIRGLTKADDYSPLPDAIQYYDQSFAFMHKVIQHIYGPGR